MPDRVRLSVLDTSPIVQGATARQALHNTLDLARLADELGLHRYWVPEHHGMSGVASAAPAVLVARIAAETRRIRVGAGGVLLPHHSPLVVAEQFGTLEALHPGRIDLGLGRAPGGPARAAEAVRGGAAPATFADKLHELLGHFDPPDGEKPLAVPAVGNRPPVWILGSSPASAELAATLGLPYAFAHHLNPDGLDAVRVYRDAFRPSAACPAPRIVVSVSVIAADTDERADWLAGPTRLKALARRRGRPVRLPSPQDAAAHPWTDAEREEIAARSRGVVVGSPDTVRAELRALVDATGADELMVRTLVHDHADRRRSYELLSELDIPVREAGRYPR